MNTNILDYGAISDGQTICSKQIQAAIDACYESGGGRVTVPAGHYRIGTIWLRSHVELHLEHGSVIQGSDDLDDYNALDAYEQNFSVKQSENWVGKHMVIAHECVDVAVTGTGTLNGNGEHFFGELEPFPGVAWHEGIRHSKDKEACRPGQLLCFIECQRVTVMDITLTNQPCWGCFLHGCEFVTIRGVKIFNSHTASCADGIDIDCCRYVTVSDCNIDTADDGITLRGADTRLKDKSKICEYITITNCVIGVNSSAFRIGVGTGMVRHARISNICIYRGANAVRLMSAYQGHGHVSIEDISISHISVTNTALLFSVLEDSANCAHIKDITMEDVHAEVYGFVIMRSPNLDTVNNICLRNIDATMIKGPEYFGGINRAKQGIGWLRGTHINNLKLEQVAVHDPDDQLSIYGGQFFALTDCQNPQISNVTYNNQPVQYQ